MGGREILEPYLNSAPKNISETYIFPHGTKSLLTSIILPSSQTFAVHSGANFLILNITK